MPCYRCGVRQTDPSRGSSPWRRGVRGDRLVLVCPACQASVPDWTAELDRCGGCLSTHLIRRLDQIECLDCGWVKEAVDGSPSAEPATSPFADGVSASSLADEVSRALDRVLGRR